MSTTVLLVEDDPDVRSMLRLLLEDENYRVLEAGDAERALERVDHDRLDLLLVDLKLPGMSGLDLVRTVRGTNPVPIIVPCHRLVGSGGSSILLKLPQAHRLKANASASIIETVFFMVVPSFLRL